MKTIKKGFALLAIALLWSSMAVAQNSVAAQADQQTWKEAAELMRALNRLMYGEKARMDHMASNLRVETSVKRSVRSFRRKASMNIAS